MPREDVYGHEMDAPYQNPSAGLLNSPQIQEGSNFPTRSASKMSDWLRQFRLQFFGLCVNRFIRRGTFAERRKVAMYKSRSMAALNSLLHVIPLSGAITMLCLHWTSFYGGDTSNDSTTLQFVAKFQELIMQISIVDLILHVVRREAVNGFVPLGAFSGAIQATQLSYLWSLDFVALFRSHALRGWRKALFVVIFPVLIILTALVGPSSAVLMIPRPGTPHTEKVATRYIYNSTQSIYPFKVGQSTRLVLNFSNLSNTIISSSYNISLQYEEEEPYCRSYLSSRDILVPYQRLLQFCAATGFEEVINSTTYGSTVVNATIPPQLVANNFYDMFGGKSFRPFLNGSISVTASYPIVTTQCKTMNTGKYPDSEVSYIRDNQSSLGVLSKLGAIASELSDAGESSTIAGQTTQYFPPFWTTSPEEDSNSTIGVFITWVSQNKTDQLPTLSDLLTAEYASARQTDLTVATCTLSAGWHNAPIQLLINAGPMIIQSDSASLTDKPDHTSTITLNLTSASDFLGAEFHHQLASLNLGYEAGLATAFAMSLSEYPALDTKMELRKPSDGDFTAFTFVATKYGWGYGQSNTAVRLSLAVVVTYCIITIAYITYTIATGNTSTAWNSAIELVVLALQSKKPELGHVSVGVESLETLGKGVGIRENQQGELELVFASGTDDGKSDSGAIKRNTAY